ncbi:T9SS type A sorting domain-containing protein [Spirosoma sp.]|uniref:T9SS type A sorting domain-containing protein n=1 Tax=Spirosoma sp. TaxID=1899569 RepID=UPI00261C4005|nr:T9SS type A sorting domain-containing protein [Spirosoma sp.]MCX6217887.1 T9SS type A sorting domain-containing protein [Spirosoma sp.]
MKKTLHVLCACITLLLCRSSFAQCPTKYYTLASTSVSTVGDGTNSLSNPDRLVDGNLNTSLDISSNVPLTSQSVVFGITSTINETIPPSTYLYLKADNLTGVTIEAYNGATTITGSDITVTTKNVYGFSFFEILSTQQVTGFKVTYSNNQLSQTRKFYEFYAGTPCSSPLPVNLTSFTAKPVNGKVVQLDWATSLERDNDYFVVERSKDLTQFETVARVKAKEGTQGHTYSFVDEQPYFGTSYYRLKQTDLNGTSSSLQTASIVFRSDSYGVFPNPVIDNKFVLRLDEPQTAEVSLYSTDGRLMPMQKTGTDEGLLMLKATRKLTTGVYLITVKERAQTRTHRIIVE